MPKLHSFSWVIHNATQNTKVQAEAWCTKNKLKWYVIALEPYEDKDGFHLHLFFRLPNPRSVDQMHKFFITYFGKEPDNERTDKPRCKDVLQEPLDGRFKDCINYVTNEYAGTHTLNPKKLDPQPVIYPQDEDPDEVKKKVCVKSEIIRMLQDGADYKDIMRKFPEYCMVNGARLQKFIKEYKPIVREIQDKRYREELAKKKLSGQKLSGCDEILADFFS